MRMMGYRSAPPFTHFVTSKLAQNFAALRRTPRLVLPGQNPWVQTHYPSQIKNRDMLGF